MRLETAIFWTINQIQKLQLSSFLPIFFSFNNKRHKNELKPYFYSVLANLQTDNFQNVNFNTET